MKVRDLHPNCLVLLALVFAGPADGQEARRPLTFEEQYNFYGGKPEGDSSCQTGMGELAKSKAGSVARFVHTYPRYLRIRRDLGFDFHVEYPDLARGEVAAFFGAVYRIDVVAGDRFSPWMRVKKIPDDKLPAGTKLAWDSLVVPPTKDGRGYALLHGTHTRVVSLDAPKEKSGKPTATIAVSYRVKEMRDFAVVEAVVKEGDVVLLPLIGHKVRRVVLPDAKTKVIGWLELSPDPVPEADLVKQKVAYVRPKKREK